jgi:hypothetical protein
MQCSVPDLTGESPNEGNPRPKKSINDRNGRSASKIQPVRSSPASSISPISRDPYRFCLAHDCCLGAHLHFRRSQGCEGALRSDHRSSGVPPLTSRIPTNPFRGIFIVQRTPASAVFNSVAFDGCKANPLLNQVLTGTRTAATTLRGYCRQF